MEHMSEKLLEGEVLSDQTAQGDGFDEVVLMEHLEAVGLRIEVQADAQAAQLRRDIIAFEIDADHAVAIDFALQVPLLQGREPAIRIDRRRQCR